MKKGLVLWIAAGAAATAAIASGAWFVSLPVAAPMGAAPAVPLAERDATIAALRPPRPGRPLVAIIGLNQGTETTDYVMSYGILSRAGVADVMTLATGPGPVALYPALRVQPQATIAQFDARHPQGADYVIVPAMRRDDDPAALAWIRGQAAKGAIIVGVCAGAKVVAAAGLLDGRRATTHWYFRKEMLGAHPAIRYVPNRRFVVDRGVATTTGVSASMPMMLTLIEAIAGPAKAESVAQDLGLAHWGARHRSDAFRFNRDFASAVIGNAARFWTHERFAIPLRPGFDEVSLALAADAWSRTYRSKIVTFAATRDAIAGRNGLRILPDKAATWSAERLLPSPHNGRPVPVLNQALTGIAGRYGARTAGVVAMQLEYAWPHDTRP